MNNLGETWTKKRGYEGLIFFIFVVILLINILLFHYLAFGPSDFRPNNLGEALNFYFHKLIPPIFIASFLFVFKRYWWSVIVLLLINIWAVCNLTYYGANELFLDVDAIMMAGNMKGFWNSVTIYFRWEYMLFFILTAVWGIGTYWLPKRTKKNWHMAFLLWVITAIYTPITNYQQHPRKYIEENGEKSTEMYIRNLMYMCAPYSNVKFRPQIPDMHWEKYIRNRSIVQYLPSMIYNKLTQLHYYKKTDVECLITKEEESEIKSLIGIKKREEQRPNSNLILIIVESLESWAIDERGVCGQEIMPNLMKWTRENSVLRCNKLKSQVKHGVSGDGQMIINTGMLPISSGATCMLYGENEYPNIAHFYDESITINPAPNIWNQRVVNKSYGIKNLVESEEKTFDDEFFAHEIEKALIELEGKEEKFFIQAITISSHTPFTNYKTRHLNFENKLDEEIDDYLQCLNYTDSCMAGFFEKFDKDSILRRSTIVITGDHTIFRNYDLEKLRDNAADCDIKIDSTTYCPLIIYSPELEKDIEIDDMCYQMDIYPTILSLIGCEEYYWRGFGVNILDSTAVDRRKTDEEKAYYLSEKMIRNNYFKEVQ